MTKGGWANQQYGILKELGIQEISKKCFTPRNGYFFKNFRDVSTKTSPKITFIAFSLTKFPKISKENRTFVFFWVCANADPVEDNITEVIKVDMQPNTLLIQYFVKDFSFTCS